MPEPASDLPSPAGPWPADLARLVAIALEAGRAILEIYHDPARIQAQTKGDGSPLTAADLAADAVIRAGLATHFAGVPVVSEESLPGPADGARTEGFLVDPVDGTKEFLKRNGEFTVNIARVVQGQAVEAVVLAPALGELFAARRGVGAWAARHGHPPRALAGAAWAPGDTWGVRASRPQGAPRREAWLRGLDLPHRIDNAGSSLKFCRLAQGLADVYPRFGPTSQWDTAAGQCVLECAGGSVFDWGGRPLAYSLTEPWLNPEFVALGCTPGLALHARLFPRAPTSRPIGSP